MAVCRPVIGGTVPFSEDDQNHRRHHAAGKSENALVSMFCNFRQPGIVIAKLPSMLEWLA